MRTLIFILSGTALFAVIFFLMRTLSPASTIGLALAIFLPIWLLVAVINLTIGVNTAGYTVVEELPILLIIFGIPAAFAGLVAWRMAS
ncbi:hypothetical protein GJW-30_1_03040 [Variibacter gotjawalensis]|uniref:Uncharacterized protein n=1 Tax=Variibacter gotjawalensis TaxID=1333996 RepID=A0A0S3PXL2_9BRAD|nr:hypothetical protein [Variibacter gotjawalensis]NIK46326.1 hypothetical protein [Variibacter gotjawalensis]RZS48236.1 hypothetical protein EV661_0642 [Variibacter gotjawalensis]BAT60496.1 hypothetical protein GJW-30_1_03040 [Variibacter gotjawalensis]